MEVLDREHRYAQLLYEYWRRWELSDTRQDFFQWLDEGQGSLLDLPQVPRRLLDESRVIYLERVEQPLFRVKIDPARGLFVWEMDGTPVTLTSHRTPDSATCATLREEAIAKLIESRLARAWRRDELLRLARIQVDLALEAGLSATPRRLEEIARPLVAEGLLRRLRDPFFHERLEASTSPEGHAHLRALPKLPQELLPGLTWYDFLDAIDHDEGMQMKRPIPRGKDRTVGKGIFVLDCYGRLYCGTKVRGVFHHTSFVRGHCVKVAGGLEIENGRLSVLSPHSGHYHPTAEDVSAMVESWEAQGVDFTNVRIKQVVKG